MELKLRKKFITISMSVVFVVLFIIIGVINFVNYIQLDDSANLLLNVLEQNNGVLPEVVDEYFESFHSMGYFTALVEDNKIIKYEIVNIRTVNEEVIKMYVFGITANEGMINNYKYKVIDTDQGTLVAFVDCSHNLYTFETVLITSIIISLVALFGVFSLIVIFSKQAVEPLIINNENQKRFITDVSHELKTPLAIIKANTEVIEMIHGNNEWTDIIHSQINGLNNLVCYLISLAKMEEAAQITKTKFNLSNLLKTSVKEIEILCQDKNIKTQIKENIYFEGEEQLITILISILLENAIKYSTEDIEVILTNKYLIVQNKASNLKVGSYDKLFERFYKADVSRNSNGSYGIGLSMAKSIATKHNKQIKSYSEDAKTITFKIEL